MVIGTVVEGETDYLMLEAIILKLFPDARILSIQPAATGKGGWRDVQEWCQETWRRQGSSLEKLISEDTGQKLDLLIIQVDADIARHSTLDLQKNVDDVVADVMQPCPPIANTVSKLQLVIARWLNYTDVENFPQEVVFAISAQDTENWVFAALFPDDDRCQQPDYECIHPENSRQHPAYLLTLKRYGKILQRKDGKIKKSKTHYRRILPDVVNRWDKVCEICSQARAFDEELRKNAESLNK